MLRLSRHALTASGGSSPGSGLYHHVPVADPPIGASTSDSTTRFDSQLSDSARPMPAEGCRRAGTRARVAAMVHTRTF